MSWSDVAGRVVVEACEGTDRDVVLVLGWSDGTVPRALAGRVGSVIVVDPTVRAGLELPLNVEVRLGSLADPPSVPGLSVVALHWTFRTLSRSDQVLLIQRIGKLLPERGLLVIGDVLWSLPKAMIDEPEQYGVGVETAPEVKELESWVRAAGFLPDTHRFGPGVAVMIALKATK